MAEQIENILKNDTIATTIQELSNKLNTTVDSLVQEFAKYYIGTHIFYLSMFIVFIIVCLAVFIWAIKKQNNIDFDILASIYIITPIGFLVSLTCMLYHIYCLVCMYCAPTITLIKYIVDMLKY